MASKESRSRHGTKTEFNLEFQFGKSNNSKPGRVAQSVGHLTRKSGILGSIPGLATYLRFSFRFFKKGSCQLLYVTVTESMCTKHWLTA